MSDKKLSLAAEAYLYGYPLVYCVIELVAGTRRGFPANFAHVPTAS